MATNDLAYDYLIKILLIGDSGVGKSCLLVRFSEDSFTPLATIGIDFKIRTIELEGKLLKLQLWDTPGQDRFRTCATVSYYRGAVGILLVYDVTDEKSFGNIRNCWIKHIEQHSNDPVNIMLIGTKCDLVEKKIVEASRGKSLADEYGMKFMETSSKDSTNVEEAFISLAKDIKKRIIDTPTEPTTIIPDQNNQNNIKKPYCY